MEGLISLILVMALVGVVLWAVTTLLPMPQPVKTLIIVVTVIVLLLWALRSVGMVV